MKSRIAERKRIIIDPLNMNENDKRILNTLLRKENNSSIFLKNASDHNWYLHNIDLKNNDGSFSCYEVGLTYTLLKFQRRKNETESRYTVVGNILGQGNQGYICNTLGTLSINDDTIEAKKKQTRVVKFMTPSILNLSATEKRNAAENEFLMMNKLPSIFNPRNVIHLRYGLYDHARYALAITQQDALISRRFDGMELKKLVDDNIINNMSLQQRIDLCKKILIALSQIHRAGVIHRDIKLDNILVELDSSNNVISVHIIDLGLARESELDTTGGDTPGNPPFAAPETWAAKPVEQPADIFAMGRIFWVLFGNRQLLLSLLFKKPTTIEQESHINRQIMEFTMMGYMPTKQKLFFGMESFIPASLQDDLYQLFLRMSLITPNMDADHNNPASIRASIEECLRRLDKIEYKIRTDQLDKIEMKMRADSTLTPELFSSHLLEINKPSKSATCISEQPSSIHVKTQLDELEMSHCSITRPAVTPALDALSVTPLSTDSLRFFSAQQSTTTPAKLAACPSLQQTLPQKR